MGLRPAVARLRAEPVPAVVGDPGRPKGHRDASAPPLQFTREVRDEIRQVAWPSRAELFNYTSVVLTTLIIMISLIFVLNLGFGKLITLLFTK
jgi:preprotein translocase subunit SecE